MLFLPAVDGMALDVKIVCIPVFTPFYSSHGVSNAACKSLSVFVAKVAFFLVVSKENAIFAQHFTNFGIYT